jgi:hypothetical protein
LKYEELIQHFGSQSAVARLLNISQPSIHRWIERGIPDDLQLRIEKASGYKLHADNSAISRALRGVPVSIHRNDNAIMIMIEKA